MFTAYKLVLIHMTYLAFAVFTGGAVWRLWKIFREPPNPSPLAVYPTRRPKWLWALHDTFFMPSIRKHMPLMWVFHMVFHICLLLLIIGHLELIREFSLIQIIPHEIFLGKGLVGLALSICLLFFLFRRFHSPYRELSVPEDYYLLILIFLTVLFGAQMNWARTWYGYETLAVVDYRDYLHSMFTFQPKLPDITWTGHSFILVLHVFFANLLLMIMPFTKIMHVFFSLPLNKLRRG